MDFHNNGLSHKHQVHKENGTEKIETYRALATTNRTLKAIILTNLKPGVYL